jgi:copper transport protein
MSWPSSPPSHTVGPRPILLALCLALTATFGLSAGVRAHTYLLGSDPADGAELNSPPREIRLLFGGDVSAELSELSLTGDDGAEVALTNRRVEGRSDLVVDVPPLRAGVYHLRWRIAAPGDLHELGGTVVFGIGRAPPAGVASDSRAQPLPLSFTRFLELLGFAALLGALVVSRVALPRSARPLDGARRRLVGLALVGAVVAIGGGGARLLLSAGLLPGNGAAAAVAGHLPGWLVTAAALAVIAAVVALHGRSGKEAWRASRKSRAGIDGVSIGASLVGAAALVQYSHLAEAGPLGTLVAATHVLAAAVWVGGLGAIVVTVPALRRSAEPDAAVAAVRRFGWVALPSAAVLGASGIVAAGVVLPTLAELSGTFGAVLAAKLTIAVAVGVLGCRNAASVIGPVRRLVLRASLAGPGAIRRWTGEGWLPRPHISVAWMVAELSAAVGVIALGAILAGTPAIGPVRGVPPNSATSSSARADDLVVALSVRPLRPGPNFVSIAVLDTRRPAPAAVTGVDLRIKDSAGRARTLEASPSLGQWVVVADLSAPGQSVGDVVIHRSGLADARASIGWELPATLTSLSERPFLVPAVVGGIALGLGGLTLAAFALRPRRPSHTAAVGDRVAPQPAGGR